MEWKIGEGGKGCALQREVSSNSMHEAGSSSTNSISNSTIQITQFYEVRERREVEGGATRITQHDQEIVYYIFVE